MLTLCTSSRAPLSNADARPKASDTACLGGSGNMDVAKKAASVATATLTSSVEFVACTSLKIVKVLKSTRKRRVRVRP
ncbi:hypothetical protein PI126_g20611 [Phytophthora idaei]|nr:hypothetical protein PI126_g20611 [Phytophthora idaei]